MIADLLSARWEPGDAGLAGGGGLVVDSRPAGVADDKDREAFAATRRACELLDWEYVVCGEMDPVVAANHRWIAGYRHPRCADPATEARLLKAFGSGLELMDGAESAGDPRATLPVLFHLMWRRELTADLSLVLSHRTGSASTSRRRRTSQRTRADTT